MGCTSSLAPAPPTVLYLPALAPQGRPPQRGPTTVSSNAPTHLPRTDPIPQRWEPPQLPVRSLSWLCCPLCSCARTNLTATSHRTASSCDCSERPHHDSSVPHCTCPSKSPTMRGPPTGVRLITCLSSFFSLCGTKSRPTPPCFDNRGVSAPVSLYTPAQAVSGRARRQKKERGHPLDFPSTRKPCRGAVSLPPGILQHTLGLSHRWTLFFFLSLSSYTSTPPTPQRDPSPPSPRLAVTAPPGARHRRATPPPAHNGGGRRRRGRRAPPALPPRRQQRAAVAAETAVAQRWPPPPSPPTLSPPPRPPRRGCRP